MAKKEVFTEIEIDASAKRVWEILTNLSDLSWNPFLQRVEGQFAPDEKLRIALQFPDGQRMNVSVTLSRVIAGSEFAWLAGPHRWILENEHRFQVIALSDARSRFVQAETFEGLLGALLYPLMNKKVEAAFNAMNQALKETAEKA